MASKQKTPINQQQAELLSNVQFSQSDALEFVRQIPAGTVDAFIFDPPYASGGLYKSMRSQSTAKKYAASSWHTSNGFIGDQMDADSWADWIRTLTAACLQALKPGGYFLSFCDWRQLVTATRAIQQGGLLYRGLIVWDKTSSSRAPHKGYFRHQCEYVTWGTKGDLKPATHGGPFDGCYREIVRPKDKRHQTAKPIGLMQHLIQCVPPGGLVVDPTAGSGSTLVAAALSGRRAMGCDLDQQWVDVFEGWRDELLGDTNHA
jgi:site-specific DNA-methyltransferase (adenine-specific)